jgi:hypothetical protein
MVGGGGKAIFISKCAMLRRMALLEEDAQKNARHEG